MNASAIFSGKLWIDPLPNLCHFRREGLGGELTQRVKAGLNAGRELRSKSIQGRGQAFPKPLNPVRAINKALCNSVLEGLDFRKDAVLKLLDTVTDALKTFFDRLLVLLHPLENLRRYYRGIRIFIRILRRFCGISRIRNLSREGLSFCTRDIDTNGKVRCAGINYAGGHPAGISGRNVGEVGRDGGDV